MSTEDRTSVVRVNERGLALWEIVSVATSSLIAQWAIQTLAGRAKWLGAIPILLAVGLMLFSHRERAEGPRDLGFRLDNFFPAFRLLLLPTIVAIVIIILVGWQQSGSSFSLGPFRVRLLFLPVWALFQQYALQGFINRRAQMAFGSGHKSIAVVAVVFGLLHLPSPLLSFVALLGGYMWGWVYQRHPNLLALALSHTVVSLFLSLSIPAHLASQLRIGFKYFG